MLLNINVQNNVIEKKIRITRSLLEIKTLSGARRRLCKKNEKLHVIWLKN